MRIPCLPSLFHTQRGHDHPGDTPAPPPGYARLFAALHQHTANVSTELRELHQQQKNACRAIAENAEFVGKLSSSAWYGDRRDGTHLQPVEKFSQLKNVISDKQFQIHGIGVQRKICSDMSTYGMSEELQLSAHFLVREPNFRRFAECETQTSPTLSDREFPNSAMVDLPEDSISLSGSWTFSTPESYRESLHLQGSEVLEALDAAIATGDDAPVMRTGMI